MPKIGVVGTIGGWSSEMLADKVAEKTGYRLLIDPKKICLDLGAKTVRYKDTDLAGLDALMIKKVGARYSPDLLDRLEMLRFLQERGLRMFSNPFAIMRVLDRLSCTVTLAGGGIPMPPTTVTEDVDAALKAVADYEKAVFKPLFSSKARGMKVISDGPDARRKVTAFKQENEIMYIQKMMDLGGQDLGVAFLGGEYLTTYARRGQDASWNTTTRSGGKYQPYTPSDKTVALAHRAQALFGLDFTCVDVAETPDGPVVFEVSAFGGFRGIQTASGLDAAGLYLEYVLKRT
ncbi:MAG: GAK system ATP-grasp enzyme [Desulfococcaceae bacterium]